MPCTIRRTPNGYLAYRLRWNGLPGYEAQESTGIKDTRDNREQRRRMEKSAELMTAEMAAGRFNYLEWFPNGSKADHFRHKTNNATVGDYIDERWWPSHQPPLVRQSTSKTYEKHIRCHIRPRFGACRFTDVTVAALEEFRATLIAPEAQGGKGLKVKTARDVIDSTFRAIYRDARKIGIADGDPFAGLDWPDKVVPEPDPYTPGERDAILGYFRAKDRGWFPFVFWQFWVGTRPSEAVGLRRARLDTTHGKASIVVSRSYGEDNPPKTKGSRRTITLSPNVLRVLRDMPRPVLPKPDDFVFATPEGHAVDVDRFVEQHWHRALSATGTRPRPFYNCRHSFISFALERGAKIKWLADYVGSSVEMIERHYGRWMQGDDQQLALLIDEAELSTPSKDRDDVPITRADAGQTGIVREQDEPREVARSR